MRNKQRNIVSVMRDPELFGRIFQGKTWDAWEVFLRVVYALPLTIEQMNLYRTATGRSDLPRGQVKEALMLVGRRGGKTRVASFIGTHTAVFSGVERHLGMGEKGVVLLLAQDRSAAGVLLDYVRGYFRQIPLLSQMVVRETSDAIELSNGCVIQIGTSDYRAIRGRTIVACVADEICFWPTSSDAASSDEEIFVAARPAMASIPNSILVMLSSPYAKRGYAYRTWRESFGIPHAETLTWVAPTRAMNATISRLTVTAAMLRDSATARSEYLAAWREDIVAFVSAEAVEACTVAGRGELLPGAGHHYYGFTDPAGGGGGDSFTCAVAHLEGERAVLDAYREIRPVFSPERAVAELAAFLKSYRIGEVFGDHYAGDWPSEQFSKHGVMYRQSELPKSQIYLEFLPLLNSQCVELLDNERLRGQLCSLERKTARGGRDSVDHQPNGHDDVINACAGALRLAHCEAGGVFGLVEYEKMGGSSQFLDMDAPKPKAVTTTFTNDPFANSSKFAPNIPPRPKVYAPCPCGGAVTVVDEAARAGQCTQCKAEVQLREISPHSAAATGFSVTRGEFLERDPQPMRFGSVASRFAWKKGGGL
jgi:hypothetical protein